MEFIDYDLLVHQLVSSQFPQWTDLKTTRLEPAGSDNVIFRLGDELLIRLPRGNWSAGQARKEHRWLPRLAPELPLAVPHQVALGVPAFGYPHHWSVVRWLDGESATVDNLADPVRTATELAGFLRALWGIRATVEAPVRRDSLADRDTATRAAISMVAAVFDADRLTKVWEKALAAPEPNRTVWCHGDMHNGNLLVVDGRLSAVIDFGGLGVGDLAGDLVVAWTLFSTPEAREAFRAASGVDEAAWTRGRGWAIATGLNAYTSYAASRPDVAAATTRQITQAIG